MRHFATLFVCPIVLTVLCAVSCSNEAGDCRNTSTCGAYVGSSGSSGASDTGESGAAGSAN